MTAPHKDRRQVLAGAGAGLLFATTAGRLAAAEAPLPTLPEASYSPEDADDLMVMEDGSRRMTAPVMVNGQGPFDFVVDTGTNRSVVSHELADRLGLAEGPLTRVHGITGQTNARTVNVQSLQIGVREAKKLHLPAMPQRMLGGAGLLGVDGLKNQRVILDFQQARLQIEPSSERWRGADSSVVAAKRRFGQLTMVDTDLHGHRVSVVIDTGSEATIGNSALRKLMVRSKDAEDKLALVQLIGATGQTAAGEFGPIPVFRLGKLTINNLRVVYANLHTFSLWGLERKPAMILGMDVLRFFDTVAVDFGRSEVRFVMPKETLIDPAGDGRGRARRL